MGAVEAGSRRLPVTATTPRQDGSMDRVRDYRAERWTSPQCFVTSPGNRGGEPWPAIPQCRSRAVRPHPCQPQPMEPSDGFGAGLDRRAEESPDRGTDGGEEREDGAVTPPREGRAVVRRPEKAKGGGQQGALVRDFSDLPAQFKGRQFGLELPGKLRCQRQRREGSCAPIRRSRCRVARRLRNGPDRRRRTLPEEDRPGFLEAEIPEGWRGGRGKSAAPPRPGGASGSVPLLTWGCDARPGIRAKRVSAGREQRRAGSFFPFPFLGDP